MPWGSIRPPGNLRKWLSYKNVQDPLDIQDSCSPVALQAPCEGTSMEISCVCIWTPPMKDYTQCSVQSNCTPNHTMDRTTRTSQYSPIALLGSPRDALTLCLS